MNPIIDCKYTVTKVLAQGSYGIISSAKNIETNENIALKKVILDDVTKAKRILREIKLLRYFKGHDNIIAMKEIFMSRNDIYVHLELMDSDLRQVISSKQPLSDDHIKYFMYQLLRGLKYIHSANILHRDLKPSNLLVNKSCDLKIGDFGLCKTAGHENHNGFMEDYIATRWYRAPEVMLGWSHYTKAIDIWSCGCILAELIGRKPLFPGRDYIQQLNFITDVIGTPSIEDLRNVATESAKKYILNLPRKQKVPFINLYPQGNPLALNLLEKMLLFDPAKRCSVENALEHPYFADYHETYDEPRACKPFNFDFEKASHDTIKDMLYKEMMALQHDTILFTKTFSTTMGNDVMIIDDDTPNFRKITV